MNCSLLKKYTEQKMKCHIVIPFIDEYTILFFHNFAKGDSFGDHFSKGDSLGDFLLASLDNETLTQKKRIFS